MPARPKADDAATWTALADTLVASEKGVRHGKMMSSDAVTFAGRVFAFYTGKGRFHGLGLRLGRAFDVDALGLKAWQHLAPFKSKPPMKDWILVGADERERWPELARLALAAMRTEVRGAR
jgi:hypothetical protein